MVKEGSVKLEALMLLANGIYSEVITEDQAINVMLAMDGSSKGEYKQLEARTEAIAPIFVDLTKRYKKESGL